jgi:hypothetical protein
MTSTETTFKEVGMNRREFVKNAGLRGVGIGARSARGSREKQPDPRMENYEEPIRRLPARTFDVVAAGAGTAAALCAARKCGTRELPYRNLRDALVKAGVYFEK